MSAPMDPATAATLRAPFPPTVVAKLPRVWCKACRDSRTKLCEQHRKVKCQACQNNITEAHLHLDYVGHAETTDRLLQADPEWTWEPFALSQSGTPFVDEHGGLWIRLTVAGVTRIGYGHADGKKGPDAVKETIGDAIRNAAMRFGVALDLWGATFKEEQHDGDADEQAPARSAPRPDPKVIRDWAVDPNRTEEELRNGLARIRSGEHPNLLDDQVVNETGDDEALGRLLQRRIHDLAGTVISSGEAPSEPEPDALPGEPMVTQEQHRHMHAMWRELGYDGDANRDNRLGIMSRLIEQPLTSSKELTEAQANVVISALKAKKRETQRERVGADA